MAYSTNPITVERMLPFLEPLVAGQEAIWRTEPNRSRWLAYKIREALAVAAEYPERFPELSTARYKIEVLSSREVRAVMRTAPEIEIDTGPREPREPARVNTVEVDTAELIIEHWQGISEEARQKVYFPNADLGEDGLLRLWEWAQGAGVLLFENLGAITLLPREGNEDAAEFAWDPSEIDTDAPRLGE